MEKPKITDINSSTAFQSWYWLKAEMVEKCKQLGPPYKGGKFELRDRIIYALENDGAVLPVVEKSKPRNSCPPKRVLLDITGKTQPFYNKA